MKQKDFLRTLDERPLRMAVEPKLPRVQIVLRQDATPAPTPEKPLPAFVIVGLACWLLYALMRTIPA